MRCIALLALVACGDRAARPSIVVAPPATVQPVIASAPPFELQLLLVEDAKEQVVRWTPELELRFPKEDFGAFAYAQRKTVIYGGSGTDVKAVGWLEPGARVGVAAATADRAVVVLFPWSSALQTVEQASVLVDARDLGPAPPKEVAMFSAPTVAVRTIGRGQWLHRTDGSRFAFTHCGALEVLGENEHGVLVRQRQDGMVVEGLVEKNASWQDGACPGRLVAEDYRKRALMHDRDREMPYRDAAVPTGLVASGPFAGPTFAELVATRAKVWWLVDDRESGPQCVEWTLTPPKKKDDDGALVKRFKLPDGDTIVTRFIMRYGDEAETAVVLLGPSSEVIAPPGKKPQSGGMSFGCGHEYRVVASEVGVLTMHEHVPNLARHVIAYDVADTERWYTERARCERDLAAKQQQVALGFAPHSGC